MFVPISSRLKNKLGSSSKKKKKKCVNDITIPNVIFSNTVNVSHECILLNGLIFVKREMINKPSNRVLNL